MARQTGTKPTHDQFSATEQFLEAFCVPHDLASALAQPDATPVFVTNAHGALYQVHRYDPYVNPWLVYATDIPGNKYELNVRDLRIEPEVSTRVTETDDDEPPCRTAKVIGYYYVLGGQVRVDVSGPEAPDGTYYARDLDQGRRVAGHMTLAKAQNLIHENGGKVYDLEGT